MYFKISKEDLEWAKKQVEAYKKIHKHYELYAETLKRVLECITEKYAPESIVQTRAKEISSFAEKIWRKKNKYKDPVNEFTDLCGGRIITHNQDEVEAISKFIEENFEIDWYNTIDISQRLKPTEFGYRSIHYIVSFKPGVFPSEDVNVEIPREIMGLKAEIQVRTFLEHVWADFSHRMVYKKPFKPPVKCIRELAALAALLEEADNILMRLKTALQTYTKSYGSYMSKDQIQKQIEILENVLEHDPDNAKIAQQIGMLTMTLGKWEKTVKTLSKYANSGYNPILRDLGTAICKLHKNNPKSPEYKKGQKYLEEYIKKSPEDPYAISALADTWKEIDEKKAKKLYKRVFELDPSHPYSLNNYIDLELLEKRDISIIPPMKPIIKTAIKKCRELANLGLNLPWAYYDMGKFYLLLKKPYKSLGMYAKAIQLSTPSWIKTNLESLQKLSNILKKLKGYNWIIRLLKLGLATKSQTKIEGPIKKGEFKEPIIIVAGGCGADIQTQMEEYRQMLIKAFQEFKGTIISGGTTAGISGIVGEIQEKNPATTTIGYIPKLIDSGSSKDDRYKEIIITNGEAFSALEPIQYWTDIIAAGIKPSQVKLLGINGGRIAAAEFRIALALGATVGILQKSGREAAKITKDPDWKNSKNLINLPQDLETIQAFIKPEKSELKPSIRETIAKNIHKEYQKMQLATLKKENPSVFDWDELPENLKESNRLQADHIIEKLQRIGYSIRKVKDRKISLIEFTEDEIETLAKMEHGRWNIERLLRGWRWGEKKDVEKKINPYLVPWDELPEDVKEWDRKTVQKIPKFLAKAGFEVYKVK